MLYGLSAPLDGYVNTAPEVQKYALGDTQVVARCDDHIRALIERYGPWPRSAEGGR